jgi:hypothetical protein
MKDTFTQELDLTPEYGACDPDNPVQLRSLARVVAYRLNKLLPLQGAGNIAFINKRRLELIEEFYALARNQATTKDDFNRVTVWLFQWADQPVGAFGTRKVCWVRTENAN